MSYDRSNLRCHQGASRLLLFVVFSFVFINYYNPVSVYLTLLVNVVLASCILALITSRIIKINISVVFFTSLILSWPLIIMLSRAEFDLYVLGKYLRVLISTYLIMIVCEGFRISARQLNKVLAWVFISHIFAIGLQLAWPNLNIPMGRLFGVVDPTELFNVYTSRKMGLTGGFDAASQVSVLSMIFFFIRYNIKHKKFDLILMLFSFSACALSSRTGMVLGGFLFVVLFFYGLFKEQGRGSALMVPVFFIVGAYVFYFALPILVHTFSLDITSVRQIPGSTSEYGTTGTLNALTGSHLRPLDIPFSDLFLGLGYDPEGTDIGYVKLIYHLGIAGTAVVFTFYLYLYIKVSEVRRSRGSGLDVKLLGVFFAFYIFVLVVMNYKSLQIYSRGAHDLLIIMYFVIRRDFRNQNIPQGYSCDRAQ